MAYDKRFGVDIPTEKQMLDLWSKNDIAGGLQKHIKLFYSKGTIPYYNLGFKHLQELIKLLKYDQQAPVSQASPVTFVTKIENQKVWEQMLSEHAERIKELDVDADLATDTKQQSGTDDSDAR